VASVTSEGRRVLEEHGEGDDALFGPEDGGEPQFSRRFPEFPSFVFM
jgi:hypothetical protein